MLTGHSYCHVFLFACPNCAGPLAFVCRRLEKNPEFVDEMHFGLNCECGWSGNLLGLVSKTRWVEPWTSAQQVAHAA
jgi:hypothetical protein